MQYIEQVTPLVKDYLAAVTADKSDETMQAQNEKVNKALEEIAGDNENMLIGLKNAAALVLHDLMVSQAQEQEAAAEAAEAAVEVVPDTIPAEAITDAE